MRLNRPRFPHWTSHPGFGVAALLVTGVLLVIHGEPQPSSHPSGTSVVVNDTSPAPVSVQAVLVVRDGTLEWRRGASVRTLRLPTGVRPTQLVKARGATILLGVIDGVQHGFLVSKNLTLTDLGPADGVVPAASGGAALVVETALGRAGEIGGRPAPNASPSQLGTATPTSSAPPVEEPQPNFVARRLDAAGRQVGQSIALPQGARIAADTPVGLVVWRPEQRIYDKRIPLEPLSAAAMLIRPDLTVRLIGPVHPLAASERELLVWDVVDRRFGLMPLYWVDSTATSTDQPPVTSSGRVGSTSAVPSASPTQVAGTTWFDRTRGLVVTGPGSFSADGSAFAVYAQVGARRRLVVARTDPPDAAHAEVAVLALAQPTIHPSGSSAVASQSSASDSTTAGDSASPSESPTAPLFGSDGFPVTAPVTPNWWDDGVIGLGTDGTVVRYVPGTNDAQLVSLGVSDVVSLCVAP